MLTHVYVDFCAIKTEDSETELDNLQLFPIELLLNVKRSKLQLRVETTNIHVIYIGVKS